VVATTTTNKNNHIIKPLSFTSVTKSQQQHRSTSLLIDSGEAIIKTREKQEQAPEAPEQLV